MKAILPVAGVGTRLRPHTHTTPKALVHVAGKPILGHILDRLLPSGVTDVVLIVGYLGDKVVDYVRQSYNVKVKFVEQSERMGLGHAIYLAKDQVTPGEPVLIVLGDTLFEADLNSVLNSNTTSIGVKKVSNPQNFGIVEVQNGNISRLIEKPSDPPTDLAVVGVYYINNSTLLFNCLQELIDKDIRSTGEYQLTDALQMMIERGEKMTFFDVAEWHDCGSPASLLQTNRRLLQKRNDVPSVPGSVIIPPVWIAPAARINNSIIGPYVSIAGDAEITRSLITNSIINQGARVSDILLAESLIGEHATVSGSYTRMNVGDSSDIHIVT